MAAERDIKRAKGFDEQIIPTQKEAPLGANSTQLLEQKLKERDLAIEKLQRENEELQNRVKALVKGNAKRGAQTRYWRKDEHERFLEALKKYGQRDVKNIAAFVGTRSPTQVRTHAQKFFLKQKRQESASSKSGSSSGGINLRKRKASLHDDDDEEEEEEEDDEDFGYSDDNLGKVSESNDDSIKGQNGHQHRNDTTIKIKTEAINQLAAGGQLPPSISSHWTATHPTSAPNTQSSLPTAAERGSPSVQLPIVSNSLPSLPNNSSTHHHQFSTNASLPTAQNPQSMLVPPQAGKHLSSINHGYQQPSYGASSVSYPGQISSSQLNNPNLDFFNTEEGMLFLNVLRMQDHENDMMTKLMAIRQYFPHRSIEELGSMMNYAYAVLQQPRMMTDPSRINLPYNGAYYIQQGQNMLLYDSPQMSTTHNQLQNPHMSTQISGQSISPQVPRMLPVPQGNLINRPASQVYNQSQADFAPTTTNIESSSISMLSDRMVKAMGSSSDQVGNVPPVGHTNSTVAPNTDTPQLPTSNGHMLNSTNSSVPTIVEHSYIEPAKKEKDVHDDDDLSSELVSLTGRANSGGLSGFLGQPVSLSPHLFGMTPIGFGTPIMSSTTPLGLMSPLGMTFANSPPGNPYFLPKRD